MTSERRRRRWPWILGAAVLVVAIPVGVLGVPVLLHRDGGSANQQESTQRWPTTVTASGDDGRSRELSVLAADGGAVDTSALAAGDRIVVSGSGYDAGQGIYVAICVIPDDPTTKPGPCLGGVPEQEATAASEGEIQWAPSNWINDDWAWKLFGARAYDDVATGTFTAYLEVVDPIGENYDCTSERCAIYTRDDHTALGDRVQDLFIPVGFAA
ncbi:hypothetical protein [Protaetiibacter mangrovi]|uniref:Uncharacterized protein n=1 Tax=Protaetiibacter mangrovi TaxID=2970926 RepID=A0ABT1ZCL8_9MICO|nr:hypothetical protein [Protaetiibacter mangrovi]MCS0498445.1 hypothetical protein [Protaetiibacter mangrovi]TPX04142.1 hypothetical protein FJ656_13425 [Schumannella luteola]